ncbi:MAG TPA: hypothetical protein VLF59_06190 [Candidatus Saccharimonadales bacterium]|nr:hypothetical protein [Candidatus Saccharimonadales bacterium]
MATQDTAGIPIVDWTSSSKADQARCDEARWLAMWWEAFPEPGQIAFYNLLCQALVAKQVTAIRSPNGVLILRGTRGALARFIRHSDFLRQIRELDTDSRPRRLGGAVAEATAQVEVADDELVTA